VSWSAFNSTALLVGLFACYLLAMVFFHKRRPGSISGCEVECHMLSANSTLIVLRRGGHEFILIESSRQLLNISATSKPDSGAQLAADDLYKPEREQEQ
jgi:hypothetical protein